MVEGIGVFLHYTRFMYLFSDSKGRPLAYWGYFQRCPAMRLGKFPNMLRNFLSV